MKAIQYTVNVCTDIAHQWYKDIQEIFIPEMKVCYNDSDGYFNSDAQRSFKDEKEVEVDDYFAKQLRTAAYFKEVIEEKIKRYWKGEDYTDKELELELDEEIINLTMSIAHDEEMTFNQLITKILKEQVEKEDVK